MQSRISLVRIRSLGAAAVVFAAAALFELPALAATIDVTDIAGRTVTVKKGVERVNLAARYADRILLLREGRIAADGSPAQVLASDALGAAYGVDVALVAASEGRLLVDARLPCQSIGSRHEVA